MIYVIPIIVLFIIVYSYKKKVNIYDEFLVGAKEGVGVAFNLVPSVVAMVLAINIFVRSGILEFFLSFLPNVGIPIEALSMAILRPISGNAALAMMNQVFTLYGPDSYAGYLASIIKVVPIRRFMFWHFTLVLLRLQKLVMLCGRGCLLIFVG